MGHRVGLAWVAEVLSAASLAQASARITHRPNGLLTASEDA